ncbi:MAG: heparinase II/III family protein [Candidatus Scatosoma sp.]
MLKDALAEYETYKDEQPPVLDKDLRDIFKKTGSRSEFERNYFKKRNFVVTLALLALIFPEREEYLIRLRNYVYSVCEEYSWAVPAHCVNEADEYTVVDLFASETACMLAEIARLLGERLGTECVTLIAKECERRVFEPYGRNNYWWESGWNNWTAVCCGNIGIAMMRIAPERFQCEKERILRSMSAYISAFPNDGNCPEGLGYWHYGFGTWVWFADTLLQYTEGKTDLFKNQKAELIAAYAQKTLLCGGVTVSVSDSSMQGKIDPVLMAFLKDKYPDSCFPIPKEYTRYWRGNVSWVPVTRMLLYGLRVQYADKPSMRDYFFPSSGQAIINREVYSLFVKAGNNDESHNHNDVGSVILATACGQVFCDLGASTYFGGYFDPKIRYGVLNASSLGHSVPIVDGMGQKFGKEYRGTMTREENRIVVDFADAYGEAVEKLTRTFCLRKKSVEMIDEVCGCKELTERFVTRIKPMAVENGVKIGNVILSNKDVAPTIRETVEEKYYVGNPQTVYLIDYVFEGLNKAVFLMEIE